MKNKKNDYDTSETNDNSTVDDTCETKDNSTVDDTSETKDNSTVDDASKTNDNSTVYDTNIETENQNEMENLNEESYIDCNDFLAESEGEELESVTDLIQPNDNFTTSHSIATNEEASQSWCINLEQRKPKSGADLSPSPVLPATPTRIEKINPPELTPGSLNSKRIS